MILFVTSNEHKFHEVSLFMKKEGLELKWEKRKYVEIQGEDTDKISLDSALRLKNEIEGDFFLEDTGLYIDALSGFPGPYSSYVASTIGNYGILNLLHGKIRDAYFTTVITYCNESNCMQFEGFLRGKISESVSGSEGFGFDPIFIPEESDVTLAEMTAEEKNNISHRSRALMKMIDYINRHQ